MQRPRWLIPACSIGAIVLAALTLVAVSLTGLTLRLGVPFVKWLREDPCDYSWVAQYPEMCLRTDLFRRQGSPEVRYRTLTTGEKIAALYVRFPPREEAPDFPDQAYYLPDLTEEVVASYHGKTEPVIAEEATYYLRGATFSFQDGKLIGASLEGFPVSSRAEGPFVDFPPTLAEFHAAFGKPSHVTETRLQPTTFHPNGSSHVGDPHYSRVVAPSELP